MRKSVRVPERLHGLRILYEVFLRHLNSVVNLQWTLISHSLFPDPMMRPVVRAVHSSFTKSWLFLRQREAEE